MQTWSFNVFFSGMHFVLSDVETISRSVGDVCIHFSISVTPCLISDIRGSKTSSIIDLFGPVSYDQRRQ